VWQFFPCPTRTPLSVLILTMQLWLLTTNSYLAIDRLQVITVFFREFL
jgi:hypothetical protein